MKSVLMSIQARHNKNIESGKKVSELRTKPPKLKPPYKVYTYESGFDGRHKVVNEWICDDITTWRICMGVPAHLPLRACVSVAEIREYSGKSYKDIAEMKISNLKIYDKPKELGEFKTVTRCKDWQYYEICSDVCGYAENKQCHDGIITKRVSRPPQSWQFVEEI